MIRFKISRSSPGVPSSTPARKVGSGKLTDLPKMVWFRNEKRGFVSSSKELATKGLNSSGFSGKCVFTNRAEKKSKQGDKNKGDD